MRERFSLEASVLRMEEIYEEMLARKSQTA
jgi:hypothetical protein